jgi:hypothetical protein
MTNEQLHNNFERVDPFFFIFEISFRFEYFLIHEHMLLIIC